MRPSQAISALLFLLTVPVIANTALDATNTDASLDPTFDLFEHESLDEINDYINATSGEVVRLSKRQANAWQTWPLKDVMLFCEKPGLKGTCTWFRTVTDWCFNLHEGDVNKEAGSLPGGLNRIGSAYSSWQGHCTIFMNKHCNMYDKKILVPSDEQTPDDMGDLRDHVQSLICIDQYWSCKDSRTGLMYSYQVPPRPPKCDIFNKMSP